MKVPLVLSIYLHRWAIPLQVTVQDEFRGSIYTYNPVLISQP